jgi:hypothetical protein
MSKFPFVSIDYAEFDGEYYAVTVSLPYNPGDGDEDGTGAEFATGNPNKDWHDMVAFLKSKGYDEFNCSSTVDNFELDYDGPNPIDFN